MMVSSVDYFQQATDFSGAEWVFSKSFRFWQCWDLFSSRFLSQI